MRGQPQVGFRRFIDFYKRLRPQPVTVGRIATAGVIVLGMAWIPFLQNLGKGQLYTCLQLAIALPMGVAGAFGVGKLLESVIVKTNGRDLLTISAITLLMVAVSLAACVWPARRAMRLDPVRAPLRTRFGLTLAAGST